MNNKIKGIYHLSQSSPEIFEEALIKTVNILQEDGQQVEIQYSTDYGQDIDGKIVYSALITGRVND